MSEICIGMDEILTRKSVSSAIASSLVDVIYGMMSGKEVIQSADLNGMMNLIMFGKQQGSNKSECFTFPLG